MDKMKRMTGRQRQIVLAAFFPLIFIPAFILAYFAFGAVNQEEIIRRRRLEDSLLLELDQTNGRIRFFMEELQDDLYESIPENDSGEEALLASEWEASQDLTGTVFVLNGSGEILLPELDGSDEANLFYWRYLNFFAGKEAIPIYQNIAEEYKEEILAEEPLPAAEAGTPGEITGMAAVPQEQPAPATIFARKGAPSEVDAEAYGQTAMPERNIYEESAPAAGEAPVPDWDDGSLKSDALADDELQSDLFQSSSIRSKEAEGLFESSQAVQEKIYDLAEQEGQQYLERNVLPQLNVEPREEETQTVVRSVYMESTRYFEEIIQSAEYGVIPRLFDSSFILLFWARQGDRIVGCELDMGVFKDRLADAVAVPANSIRYLNILDSAGDPLIPFPDKTREEWRRPFVAKEISEWLPYWETAILLQDPEEFQRQLESSRYLLTFMITALSAVLLAAIIVIFRLSATQMKEVQQRVGFVTNVTHELKTPLTSIRLYSEMLSQGFQTDPEKVTKYSGYIARESQRLTRLISNVLDFAKWERGSRRLTRERLELNGLAEETAAALREEYEKDGFSLDISTGEEPLFILADREAVVQVILNLLSNGRKYSEETRELTLETGRNGKGVYLTLSDRGIGIPRKFRKRIFREFYRVDTSITTRYKGTGLGLAIAAQIMKSHGGSLTYAPRDKGNYRRGSRFTMQFPPLNDEGDRP